MRCNSVCIYEVGVENKVVNFFLAFGLNWNGHPYVKVSCATILCEFQAVLVSIYSGNQNFSHVFAKFFEGYEGSDWIQCVYCLGWVCGDCNEESTDPLFSCPSCDQE